MGLFGLTRVTGATRVSSRFGPGGPRIQTRVCQMLIQWFIGFGSTRGTLIAHNLVRDPMFMEHLFLENPCCAKSSQVHPNPLNQCLLGELVDNDQNGIMST